MEILLQIGVSLSLLCNCLLYLYISYVDRTHLKLNDCAFQAANTQISINKNIIERLDSQSQMLRILSNETSQHIAAINAKISIRA